ncbi:MAG: hypothetical protein Ct9H90mP2_01810 [Dehalococcoidia bacterium]|nr:MAG: hypothetical protein Ct9H90mP2_01810 [Dehalococcoidia bacterium]
MAFVETDIQDQIIIIKLNRPERLNALSLSSEKVWLTHSINLRMIKI